MKISVSYNPSYYLLLTILLNRSEVVLNIQVVNLFVQKKSKLKGIKYGLMGLVKWA